MTKNGAGPFIALDKRDLPAFEDESNRSIPHLSLRILISNVFPAFHGLSPFYNGIVSGETRHWARCCRWDRTETGGQACREHSLQLRFQIVLFHQPEAGAVVLAQQVHGGI